MPTHAGPNTKGEENLVFAYDTGDTVNSYRGEPTTNILPNASVNGNFTTSNQWGTYNTNQYNGNQYFSIGTIVDITDNIITTSTSHPLRTYDAVNPQTTGGGLTGGTTYFIRKLSDTTFTIHAYNSSQNGSQGYINPNTGKHKVHDSIWLDQRVSVNTTNFPTMWKGNPHLPNSGIVKEIIEGGGYEKGTNAMRLHLQRGDNVRDGMAYGVNTPVTVGDIVTVSFYYKAVNSKSVGKSLIWLSYFGSGQPNFSTSVSIGDEGETLRFTKTFTAPATFNFNQYWFPQASTDIYAIDISNLMVEINGHATPFTTGTRSATQGLLDLTGNSTIDLTNVSFDSNAQMTFDGTNDRISIPAGAFPTIGTEDFTLEFVCKNTKTSSYNHFFCVNNQYHFAFKASNTSGILYVYRTSALSTTNTVSAYIPSRTEYYHIVAKRDGDNIEIFINGISQGTKSGWGSISIDNNLYTSYIGWGNASEYTGGDIPVAKVYNRALTASEIKSNYNAIKGRFNI